jgi:hypothetical protein
LRISRAAFLAGNEREIRLAWLAEETFFTDLDLNEFFLLIEVCDFIVATGLGGATSEDGMGSLGGVGVLGFSLSVGLWLSEVYVAGKLDSEECAVLFEQEEGCNGGTDGESELIDWTLL